jgi:hypothetical protein
LLGAALAAFSVPAFAQESSCLPRGDLTTKLKNEYKETPTVWALGKAGVMELWTSKDRQTWTLFLSLPDGTSCVMGAGNNWALIEDLGPST